MIAHTVQYPPDFVTLPYPIYVRLNEFETNDRFLSHRHPWGQLSYSASGVMALTIEGRPFRVPPQYALWTPPEKEHDAHTLQGGRHHSVYIDAALCRGLPAEPCALQLSPILKAILEDFATRRLNVPHTPADRRLTEVLLDQMRQARCSDSYLPGSNDPQLSRLLDALQHCPGNNDTLAQWAEQLHSTERTLARRCQRELGMSFGEWRQRLRFLTALSMLEKDLSVLHIALDLGYSTASAFIAMFQRRSGLTPEQYRRQHQ
ncbi:AraC family transcriptional regulator [Paludibacterium purpuratum]|uniref:AraC family transcriptional regulator n=1 Tax=Paludibacterium purpuratum TaxID=1144873 RepID=A0A4R7BGM9_9NEIS|nr:helix-turn-helix transcriptional regulator [Paludibacterium purpuratum]TDR82886.1 AraC family transcriptional regulator [Paludibacterium purpuratum]